MNAEGGEYIRNPRAEKTWSAKNLLHLDSDLLNLTNAACHAQLSFVIAYPQESEYIDMQLGVPISLPFSFLHQMDRGRMADIEVYRDN